MQHLLRWLKPWAITMWFTTYRNFNVRVTSYFCTLAMVYYTVHFEYFVCNSKHPILLQQVYTNPIT